MLLIGNYVPDGQTSMLAFKRILERELPHLGCELRVLTPPRRGAARADHLALWKWLGYVDKFILFMPVARRAICAGPTWCTSATIPTACTCRG